MRDLTRYMYSNGYDLRHFMSMAIVPGVAEIILSVYHAVRDYKNQGSPGKASMPDRLKRQQMLLLTHAPAVLGQCIEDGLIRVESNGIESGPVHDLGDTNVHYDQARLRAGSTSEAIPAAGEGVAVHRCRPIARSDPVRSI